MYNLFKKYLGWWSKSTVGTDFTIFKKAAFVGKDKYGNTYFEDKKIHKTSGKKRRFVKYRGLCEPSIIPPEWHGWLHYTYDKPLDVDDDKKFIKNHMPNLTGTPLAYYPKGSLNYRGNKEFYDKKPYQSWKP